MNIRKKALSEARAIKHVARAIVIAVALVVCVAGNATAAPPPPSVGCESGQTPNVTVEIHNNSTQFNIYPVLFAGAPSATDTWMQACFKLTDDQLQDNPYPRANQYRMYINCCASGENGIPPGGSVTITLPLYSPLVGSINPTLSGQLIDWWQGGGINLYEGPATSTAPQALLQHWAADQNGNQVAPTSNPPTCSGCNLHFFNSPDSIPNGDPQQLIEYTLGAQPTNPDHQKPNQPARLWVPNNVDYD